MLLSCLAADRPFHAAAAAFEAAFAEERFVALCRLLLLLEVGSCAVSLALAWVMGLNRRCPPRLQDSHVLRLPQRIAARYLLFSCWPPGQAENPFLSFLIKVRWGAGNNLLTGQWTFVPQFAACYYAGSLVSCVCSCCLNL